MEFKPTKGEVKIDERVGEITRGWETYPCNRLLKPLNCSLKNFGLQEVKLYKEKDEI